MSSQHEIEQILNRYAIADNHRESDYFAAIRQLVAGRGRAAAGAERAAWQGAIDRVYTLVRDEILTNSDRPRKAIAFGTSGWRGTLGKDLFVRSVATVTAAMREKDVALADVQADNRVMISRSLRELTQADLAELGRLAKAKPHLLKLNAAAQAMAPIRVRMENEPMRPEIEAQMLADMESAAKEFVAHARAAQGLPPAPEPEVDPAPVLDTAGKPLPRT